MQWCWRSAWSVQVWRADVLCRYGICGDSPKLERTPLWILPGQLRTCWVTDCVVGVVFRHSSDSLAHALLLRLQLCRQRRSDGGPSRALEKSPRRIVLRSRLDCGRTRSLFLLGVFTQFLCNCFAVVLFCSGSWWLCSHPHRRRACFRYFSNPCAAASFYFSFFFSFVFWFAALFLWKTSGELKKKGLFNSQGSSNYFRETRLGWILAEIILEDE